MEDFGEKLTNIIDELNSAGVHGVSNMAAADIDSIREQRDKLEEYLNDIESHLIEALMANKFPLWKDSTRQSGWFINADDDSIQADNQELWDSFTNSFLMQGVSVVVKEDHDGGGLRSWVNIYLEPATPKKRSGDYGHE